MKLLSDRGVFDKGLKFRSMFLPDLFIDQDTPEKMYEKAGLNSNSIVEKIEEALKSKFLTKAKQNHPDFYVNDQEKYADAMEQTSLNNQAFKVLSKFDSRLEYILKRYGLLEESKKVL